MARCKLVLIVVLHALSWGGMAFAQSAPCLGTVFEDGNGNGRRDPGERGLQGIGISDGEQIVRTDALGMYAGLAIESGRTLFAIKPAGYRFAGRDDGLPDFWRHLQPVPGPALKYGGIPVEVPECRDFALRKESRPPRRIQQGLKVLVFGDPQPKSASDVDYYARDIVESVMRDTALRMDHGFPCDVHARAGG